MGVPLAIILYKTFILNYNAEEYIGNEEVLSIKKNKQNLYFIESIKKFVLNYFNFRGCASRKEFWCPVALIAALSICSVVFSLDYFLYRNIISLMLLILFFIFHMFCLLPMITVTCRRLHDIGKSGLWYFLNFIPIVGSLIVLIWCAKPSLLKGESH